MIREMIQELCRGPKKGASVCTYSVLKPNAFLRYDFRELQISYDYFHEQKAILEKEIGDGIDVVSKKQNLKIVKDILSGIDQAAEKKGYVLRGVCYERNVTACSDNKTKKKGMNSVIRWLWDRNLLMHPLTFVALILACANTPGSEALSADVVVACWFASFIPSAYIWLYELRFGHGDGE